MKRPQAVLPHGRADVRGGLGQDPVVALARPQGRDDDVVAGDRFAHHGGVKHLPGEDGQVGMPGSDCGRKPPRGGGPPRGGARKGSDLVPLLQRQAHDLPARASRGPEHQQPQANLHVRAHAVRRACCPRSNERRAPLSGTLPLFGLFRTLILVANWLRTNARLVFASEYSTVPGYIVISQIPYAWLCPKKTG